MLNYADNVTSNSDAIVKPVFTRMSGVDARNGGTAIRLLQILKRIVGKRNDVLTRHLVIRATNIALLAMHNLEFGDEKYARREDTDNADRFEQELAFPLELMTSLSLITPVEAHQIYTEFLDGLGSKVRSLKHFEGFNDNGVYAHRASNTEWDKKHSWMTPMLLEELNLSAYTPGEITHEDMLSLYALFSVMRTDNNLWGNSMTAIFEDRFGEAIKQGYLHPVDALKVATIGYYPDGILSWVGKDPAFCGYLYTLVSKAMYMFDEHNSLSMVPHIDPDVVRKVYDQSNGSLPVSIAIPLVVDGDQFVESVSGFGAEGYDLMLNVQWKRNFEHY